MHNILKTLIFQIVLFFWFKREVFLATLGKGDQAQISKDRRNIDVIFRLERGDKFIKLKFKSDYVISEFGEFAASYKISCQKQRLSDSEMSDTRRESIIGQHKEHQG